MIPIFTQDAELQSVFPGEDWETRTPAEVGMDKDYLVEIQEYMEGRGIIVRSGYIVYSWGDIVKRSDIASAGKPFYSHFLFKAVEEGKLTSLDEKIVDYEPCINNINSELGYKDKQMTFRQMANQISDYGVSEQPGTAFDYNDWQMALFWDTLFKGIYGATYSDVDSLVFDPYLNNILQMQDDPTFMAFGINDRPGRVAISLRDHARFGLLYLNKGMWNGIQVIDEEYAVMAVMDSVPLAIPRTTGIEAEMCPGQRSIGSTIIPDDLYDHNGSYSWLWWINGIDADGNRKWPDGPTDAYAAIGHIGKRGLAVIPSLGVVIAWNESVLKEIHGEIHPLNKVFQLLNQSIVIPLPTPEPTIAPEPTIGPGETDLKFMLPLVFR